MRLAPSIIVAVLLPADVLFPGEPVEPRAPEAKALEAAPAAPAAVAAAEQMLREILKAEAERYPVLLRDCMVAALNAGTPAEAASYYQVLAACVAENQPLALRMAVVRAMTVPVPGKTPRPEGARILLKYLGAPPVQLRTAVREGLSVLVPQDAEQLVPALVELVASIEAPRAHVEDAAHLLWAVDPRLAVTQLVKGLRARVDARRDPAAYYQMLSSFLHTREPTCEGWEKYWRENPEPAALRETHFVRQRIEEEVSALWESGSDVLRSLAGTEAGLEASWPFIRRSLDSPWVSVRIGACRELGLLGAKHAQASSPSGKAVVGRMVRGLAELAGAAQPPRYEPTAVRVEAVRALSSFRAAAAEHQRLVQVLGEAISQQNEEPAFRMEALRAAGELVLESLREAICNLILSTAKEGNLDLGLLTEAIKAAGRIGLVESGAPDPEREGRVIKTMQSLFDRVAAQEGAAAAAFRQAVVSTLGKVGVGSGEAALGVKKFLRDELRKNLDADQSLAFFLIYALGELGDIETLPDLAGILAKRTASPPNLVQAAVDAIWRIGSSGSTEAAGRAVEVFADHIESSDAVLSKTITQKVLFLCRSSIALLGKLASSLARDGKFQSASEILMNDEIVKVRQLALIEGSVDDFTQFLVVEQVLLDAYEALDRFSDCLEETRRVQGFLAERRQKSEYERIVKAQEARLAHRQKVVTAKKALVEALDQKNAADSLKAFKALAACDEKLAPWGLERIRKAEIGPPLVKAIREDPDVPETIKGLLKADQK